MSSKTPFGSQGWLLVAGCGLAAIGLARGLPQGGNPQTPPQKTQIVPVTSIANADSNNRMIAVTGTDITGASILYLVDTLGYQMAVYQASGGGDGTQGLKLIGARRIDLDLQLDGLNDKSDWTYKKLKAEFEKNGLLPGAAQRPGSAPELQNK
jgi:hypothetical protein